MIIAFGTLMENLLIDVSEDTVICGSDEAGRGPLAGPVVAAAVILPHDFPIGLLGDSKKMSEKRRLEVEAVIKEKAVAWATAAVSHRIIDRINILNASLLAMSRAYMKASRIAHADMLLVDDVQFLKGRKNTEETFFSIFNMLISLGRQVVLTSDTHPSKMEGFSSRLLTRFAQGLTLSVNPPDQSTASVVYRQGDRR